MSSAKYAGVVPQVATDGLQVDLMSRSHVAAALVSFYCSDNSDQNQIKFIKQQRA